MPIVDMKQMLQHAHQHGYAVGGFDVVSLDFVEGVIRAAERCEGPIILSLAESHFDHYDFELLMAAVEASARRSPMPVAIHLDHGESEAMAIKAINLGCNGVMVDASKYPLEENIAHTRAITTMAHGCGVAVEGELGYVPGVEGEDAERHPGEVQYTSVEDAQRYVQETGVDCLAVSIGTVHGRMQGEPKLDLKRLGQINQSLQIPLVIHGGTGLGEDQYRALIANGVAKINYYTALADAAAAAIRATDGNRPGYTALTAGVREAVADETERMIRLWGGAGRAQALLKHCRRWSALEHTILYNTANIPEEGVDEMMAEGQRVLGAIPGVRRVFCGEAVQDKAAYRYSWHIQFCHPAVIDSYREHPDHVAFANSLFRPVAADRISIDYRERSNQ